MLVILEHHQLKQTDNAPVIRPQQLTSLIHDIFYAAEKLGIFKDYSNFNLDTAVATLSNWFWNIFDG